MEAVLLIRPPCVCLCAERSTIHRRYLPDHRVYNRWQCTLAVHLKCAAEPGRIWCVWQSAKDQSTVRVPLRADRGCPPLTLNCWHAGVQLSAPGTYQVTPGNGAHIMLFCYSRPTPFTVNFAGTTFVLTVRPPAQHQPCPALHAHLEWTGTEPHRTAFARRMRGFPALTWLTATT